MSSKMSLFQSLNPLGCEACKYSKDVLSRCPTHSIGFKSGLSAGVFHQFIPCSSRQRIICWTVSGRYLVGNNEMLRKLAVQMALTLHQIF